MLSDFNAEFVEIDTDDNHRLKSTRSTCILPRLGPRKPKKGLNGGIFIITKCEAALTRRL